MKYLPPKGFVFPGVFALALVFFIFAGYGDLMAQDEKDADEKPDTGRSEITLSIGDGFVFGETEARPGKDRSNLDLYVQDIRHGVSLAAMIGCTVPAKPMTSLGMPTEPLQLIDLLKDAPLDLPKRDAWLLPKCSPRRLGIALAKGRSGKTYKLCLLEIDGHPEALRRTVRIAYEEVPQVKGGGVLQLPEIEGKPDAETTASLREALRFGAWVPGDSFSRDIDGDYVSVSGLADGAVPEGGAYIALTEELNTSVRMENRGAIFAGNGIGEEGSVLLDAYGAIGVHGAMRGRIDLDSYGYIYVDGPMEGTLNLDSYATVVLRQGLDGTVLLRSYTDMLIQGPINGTIDANGSCWCTLYFDGEYSAAALAKMSPARGGARGDLHQITLHVRESDDLAAGEHEDIGSWRKVIVGDPVWEKLE